MRTVYDDQYVTEYQLSNPSGNTSKAHTHASPFALLESERFRILQRLLSLCPLVPFSFPSVQSRVRGDRQIS